MYRIVKRRSYKSERPGLSGISRISGISAAYLICLAAVSLILLFGVSGEAKAAGDRPQVKVATADRRALTISWTKVSGAAGYQLEYSYDKKFTKSCRRSFPRQTCKVTLRNLRGRAVCYVRVRALSLKKIAKTEPKMDMTVVKSAKLWPGSAEFETTKNSAAVKNAVKQTKMALYGPWSRPMSKLVPAELVVIDPGHQLHGDSRKEPNGPGSRKTKARVTGGTRGVYTKIYEYELNLVVGKKLQKILEERGYLVRMTRTKNNVNISNMERAKFANDLKADAVIRIHANAVNASSKQGINTKCISKKNPYYIAKLFPECYKLSRCVVNAVCKATGAKNRQVDYMDDLTGSNWSRVPVTLIEMGYMSNKEEDKKLAQDAYRNKLAKGIADGLDEYFGYVR